MNSEQEDEYPEINFEDQYPELNLSDLCAVSEGLTPADVREILDAALAAEGHELQKPDPEQKVLWRLKRNIAGMIRNGQELYWLDESLIGCIDAGRELLQQLTRVRRADAALAVLREFSKQAQSEKYQSFQEIHDARREELDERWLEEWKRRPQWEKDASEREREEFHRKMDLIYKQQRERRRELLRKLNP
jgi:predicted transcriptional regulator